MANKFIHKLMSGYQFIALTLMNTLVALFILNVILFAIFFAVEHFRQNPISVKYGLSTVNSVYPGMSEKEVNSLLKETWSRPYIYEPFTQFKERPFHGTYVNVDSNGFRITKNQGAWPPEHDKLNIFLFGGSTTFGYGVADDQTIATYLQELLSSKLNHDIRIYNFGRGYYYSTQERILYEKLLASGIVPDVAIFIDGLNDFYFVSDEPLYTERFQGFVDQGKLHTVITNIILKTSLGKAVSKFGEWISKKYSNGENAISNHKYGDLKVIDRVIQKYINNKKLIEAVSRSYGVTPLFVWQPVPTYHYNQRYHLFSAGGYDSYSGSGYERMAEFLQKNSLGKNFLWCADMQKNKSVPLYVDKVHYSASFSHEIAIEIANLIIKRSLIIELGSHAMQY